MIQYKGNKIKSLPLPDGAATEVTLEELNQGVQDILSQIDVELSTRASETTLLAVKSLLEAAGVFTKELTESVFTLEDRWAVRKITIYNGSDVSGYVVGNQQLGSNSPTTITIESGESFALEAPNTSVIAWLNIIAPTSCTLKIVCLV